MAAPTGYRESGFLYNGVDAATYPGYQWNYRGFSDLQGGMQYTQQAPYRQPEYNYAGWRIFQWGTYRRTPGTYREANQEYRGVGLDFPEYRQTGLQYRMSRNYFFDQIVLGLEAALSASATIGAAAEIPIVITPDGMTGTFTFTIPASDSGGPIKFGVVGLPGPDSSSMSVSSLLNLIDPEQLIQKPIPDVQLIVTSPSGVTLLVTTV
jgi:hypothetical protein